MSLTTSASAGLASCGSRRRNKQSFSSRFRRWKQASSSLVLAQLIKEQRMASITDEQLKIILQQMAHKREPTIRFR
ncbi:hypothetical protein HYU19_06215 [Candidatus Woesearchaeota archaeon]|nr:hypothetical protein [Candidatus Woesearchaeota archaeon]